MVNIRLRIHGDNILECENALKLLVSSLCGSKPILTDGSAYSPIFSFKSDGGKDFHVQLFPGYGRWQFPLVEYIASIGGMLREAPDAIVTRLEIKAKKLYERPLLALEFSGALPAGNNAWQRTGRALTLAYAGIPYLYFAELGGQELNAKRVIKAARFPNPLVPFAYAVLGNHNGSISLPVYIPSPSIHSKIVEIFKDCFGEIDSIKLIRAILLSKDTKNSKELIENKVVKIIEILSTQRKRNDILKPEEWRDLYKCKTGLAKADWLTKKAMPWNKKVGIKPLTPTFPMLLNAVNKIKAAAIGSKDMPICIISGKDRLIFADHLKKIYKDKIDSKFQEWISNASRPLLCVWVAGFKPKGDDSRPDRGLVPMARMIFGLEDVDLLTVVYGPAKPSTWALLQGDMWKLASTNGLWEAILNLSNGLIIDSYTGRSLKNYGFIVSKKKGSFEKKLLPAASETPHFGEHDVDSVLHTLFSSSFKHGTYEALCNPPGGDWSGINIVDFVSKKEFRWTSLPRVSGTSSKRPDHLIQFKLYSNILSIESKDSESTLENKIGPRLIHYAQSLLAKAPIAFRSIGEMNWKQYAGKNLKGFNFLSGAAFRFQKEKEIHGALKRGKVDIVFGVEFKPKKKRATIHIITSERGKVLIPIIKKLSKKSGDLIKIKPY